MTEALAVMPRALAWPRVPFVSKKKSLAWLLEWLRHQESLQGLWRNRGFPFWVKKIFGATVERRQSHHGFWHNRAIPSWVKKSLAWLGLNSLHILHHRHFITKISQISHSSHILHYIDLTNIAIIPYTSSHRFNKYHIRHKRIHDIAFVT
jgi:hypothetical protein